MDIRSLMLTEVPVVTPDASLREVAEILSRSRGAAVVVLGDDGEVLGLITEAVLAGVLDRIFDGAEDGADPRAGQRAA